MFSSESVVGLHTVGKARPARSLRKSTVDATAAVAPVIVDVRAAPGIVAPALSARCDRTIGAAVSGQHMSDRGGAPNIEENTQNVVGIAFGDFLQYDVQLHTKHKLARRLPPMGSERKVFLKVRFLGRGIERSPEVRSVTTSRCTPYRCMLH